MENLQFLRIFSAADKKICIEKNLLRFCFTNVDELKNFELKIFELKNFELKNFELKFAYIGYLLFLFENLSIC